MRSVERRKAIFEKGSNPGGSRPGTARRPVVGATRLLALALFLAVAAGGCGERGAEARGFVTDTALVRMVEELLPEVERTSGLRAVREPRIALASRERLRDYLLEQLDEQLPPDRAARLVAAYARFGLLPDTLDIRSLLEGLYEEQVVGFYDPATDTLYVVEGVPDAQLEMVLVHELVHALQDQHVDLDSLTRTVRDHNDLATAVHAAIEGQATLAMMEWQMGRMMGRQVDVTQLPDLREHLDGADLGAVGDGTELGVLRDAPRVIRETLIFPYMGGLGYVQALWRAHPDRPAPFGPHLPLSTRQVMHPDRFPPGRDGAPVPLRFPESPPEGWEEVHGDVLGALEVRILLEEHLGDPERARAVAAGWAGDRFRVLDGPEGEALIWATVWRGASAADRFASAMREALARRYGTGSDAGAGAESGTDAMGLARLAGRRILVRRSDMTDGPAVLVLDFPEELDAESDWAPARFLAGED